MCSNIYTGVGTPHITPHTTQNQGGTPHKKMCSDVHTGGGDTAQNQSRLLAGWLGGPMIIVPILAPSCKLKLARFSAKLRIQDGAECGKNNIMRATPYYLCYVLSVSSYSFNPSHAIMCLLMISLLSPDILWYLMSSYAISYYLSLSHKITYYFVLFPVKLCYLLLSGDISNSISCFLVLLPSSAQTSA